MDEEFTDEESQDMRPDEEWQEELPEEDIADAPQNPELQAAVAEASVNPNQEHHEQIYDILTQQDEITWRSIILELIKSEQMDPWDINISLLTKLYIKALKKLKEMNLHLSGKILLAAALLLRIKSSRLIGDDLMEFDRLLASGADGDDLYSEDDGFVEGEFNQKGITLGDGQHPLIPKTPQPRKRKVSVYDLIDALALALKVKRRRVLNQIQTKTMAMPEKQTDISSLMDDLYEEVMSYITTAEAGRITFSQLVPGDSKHDKVYTFVPLLHLTNARKVDLDQRQHFGEIWVSLVNDKQAKQKEKLDKQKEDENEKLEAEQKPELEEIEQKPVETEEPKLPQQNVNDISGVISS
ncbi:MAG: segregation/condensation protein A [Candidatus Woesearchaeota archaeon]